MGSLSFSKHQLFHFLNRNSYEVVLDLHDAVTNWEAGDERPPDLPYFLTMALRLDVGHPLAWFSFLLVKSLGLPSMVADKEHWKTDPVTTDTMAGCSTLGPPEPLLLSLDKSLSEFVSIRHQGGFAYTKICVQFCVSVLVAFTAGRVWLSAEKNW